ncbi:CsbD family protein [Geminocystis sp. NIES-3709]|uniref:CsbD family protein n=1 Tax=Geminocystis sp. NIES-3709 TaxID=1617448 RepID=UPI0005FC675E|nr:CsbD family protein [Geminocystis sp. NIES-3709]BAQ65353.1 hypothetical protein GM3709_2118 [Geminocystis sp. NIES-3709]
MILFEQARKLLFITITLFFVISTATAFGAIDETSYASKLGVSSMNPPSNQIAWWGEGKAKAVSKNIEGKTQETIGNMKGDPKDQFMGKAKQVESKVRNKTEDIKDSMSLKGRAQAVAKNIEGKTQEAIGNMTGNTKDQSMGKAKQLESQARNTVEDVKGN